MMLEIWLPTAADRVGGMEGRHQLGRSWPYWLPSSSGPPTDAKANQRWTRKTQIDDTRASSDCHHLIRDTHGRDHLPPQFLVDYFFILLDPATGVRTASVCLWRRAMVLMGLTGVTQGVKHRRGLVLGVAFILGWLAGTSINTCRSRRHRNLHHRGFGVCLAAVAAARHAAGGTLAVLTGATGAFWWPTCGTPFRLVMQTFPGWVVPLAAFGFVAGLTMIAQTLAAFLPASARNHAHHWWHWTVAASPGLSEAYFTDSGSPLLIPSILVMLAASASSANRRRPSANFAQASGELHDEDLEDDEEDVVLISCP